MGESSEAPAGEARARGWLFVLDGISVTAFGTLQAFWWSRVLSERPDAALWVLPGLAFGWLLSDLTSGAMHFLADHCGREDWPVVGRAILRPFREHHREPRAILEHGFLERNGNNALVVVLAVGWMPVVVDARSLPGLLLSVGALSWGLWTVLTNQIHAWAHAEEVPASVRFAQRLGLFLSREQHELHHRPPYRSHYCITSGLFDRLLAPREDRRETFPGPRAGSGVS